MNTYTFPYIAVIYCIVQSSLRNEIVQVLTKTWQSSIIHKCHTLKNHQSHKETLSHNYTAGGKDVKIVT